MFTITDITPSTKELTPSLHVHLGIEHNLTNCCHLGVMGLMFSSDDKFLATGEEIRVGDYTLSSGDFQEISSCDINSRYTTDTFICRLCGNTRILELPLGGISRVDD
jgi:hypothetical protein